MVYCSSPITNLVLVHLVLEFFSIYFEQPPAANYTPMNVQLPEGTQGPLLHSQCSTRKQTKVSISVHEVYGKVYVDQLVHMEQQKQQVAVLCSNNASPWDIQYLADSVDDQTMA